MQTILIIAVSLHVIAAVFWAGTTFTLARTAGALGERLFRPQMGAAAVAIFAGAWLWTLTHAGAFGSAERVLLIGALCALAAAGVQGAIAGTAIRGVARGEITELVARPRFALAQRIAAGLLIIALLSMVTAPYA